MKISPLVSIILPTYNRAEFLPQAVASILAQIFGDWELIIVDDGSTDTTRDIVPVLTKELMQPVRYVRQENAGPAAARNTGIGIAACEFIAFFDSDDEWLPHHLSDSLLALQSNPEVDWVYSASQIINENGSVVSENCFYSGGKPEPFLKLSTKRRGELNVLDDSMSAACAIEYGLYSGLQCSVFRARFFLSCRIPLFRIGEDRMLPVLALKDGVKVGYFNKIHVKYKLHSNNSVLNSSRCSDLDRQVDVYKELINVYQTMLIDIPLNASERRAVFRRLLKEYFWHLGYNTYWKAGYRDRALAMFRKGLQYWPWNWRCWKTYWVCRIRIALKHNFLD